MKKRNYLTVKNECFFFLIFSEKNKRGVKKKLWARGSIVISILKPSQRYSESDSRTEFDVDLSRKS